MTIFGGTGGLGSQINDLLNSLHEYDNLYEIDPIGSKICDLYKFEEIKDYFRDNKPDIVLFFSALNIDGFLHKQTDVHIQELIRINIGGVTYATTLAIDHMRKSGYGRIIYASSIVVDKNVIGTAVYAATKAYYENIVKTIAIENAAKGITANCIQLGYMNGGLTYKLPKDLLTKKLDEIPSKRLGTIAEIVATIQFLISTEYVNGATIKLTGGL